MKPYKHKALAVRLYQEEVLSLAKAAKLADMPIDKFIAVLGAAGISVVGYDTDDLDNELAQF